MLVSSFRLCVAKTPVWVKGSAIVERKLSAIEEVAGGLNDFLSNDGKEVTNLYRGVAVSGFEVNLWQCMAVSATVVPRVIQWSLAMPNVWVSGASVP